MKRFPYAIFYTIEEDKNEIFIAAVWHTKRNPKILKDRL